MTALVTKKVVLISSVLTEEGHCSQNAVIGSQLVCPYIKIVLVQSVLTSGSHCNNSILVHWCLCQKLSHVLLFAGSFTIVIALSKSQAALKKKENKGQKRKQGKWTELYR